MSLPRLLMHLMLVLALVASGLASAAPMPADGSGTHAQAPCHGDDPPPPDAGGDDCCSGPPGHCGCDCLQHATAAMPLLAFLPALAPTRPVAARLAAPHARGARIPDIRPPIA